MTTGAAPRDYLLRAAESAQIELIVADNRYQPKIALKTAQQDPGRPGEQLGHEGAGLGDVLEVVHHQQGGPVAQPVGDHVDPGATGRVGQAERPDHGQADQGRIGDGGQRHEPHTVREPRGQRP